MTESCCASAPPAEAMALTNQVASKMTTAGVRRRAELIAHRAEEAAATAASVQKAALKERRARLKDSSVSDAHEL